MLEGYHKSDDIWTNSTRQSVGDGLVWRYIHHVGLLSMSASTTAADRATNADVGKIGIKQQYTHNKIKA